MDFVVHIFSHDKRAFYDIERLRKTATAVGLEELKASLAKKVAQVRKKQPAKKAASNKIPTKKASAKKAQVETATKRHTKKAPKKNSQK